MHHSSTHLKFNIRECSYNYSSDQTVKPQDQLLVDPGALQFDQNLIFVYLPNHLALLLKGREIQVSICSYNI